MSEQKTITTVIFDCFGVICSEVINGWFKENVLNKGFVDPHLKKVLRDLDLGKIREEDIVTYFMMYDFMKNYKNHEVREQIDAYLHVDSKLVDIILGLKQKGIKTALLSNANSAFFERKIYPNFPQFKNLFDQIIISSDVQMLKPEPAIYLYALQKLDSKPEQTLFVDDNQENITTAVELGMKTFLYTYNHSEKLQEFLEEENK